MNLVKEYREKRGLTQAELAEELSEICPGIDRALISKFESGICVPTSEVSDFLLKACAHEFNESLSDLGIEIPSSIKNVLKGSFLSNTVFLEISKGSKDNPITRGQLRHKTGKSDREVREIISQLRQAGARIGSSSGTAGYWLCESEADYRQLRAEYTSRIKTYAEIVRAMDGNLAGQIEWEL